MTFFNEKSRQISANDALDRVQERETVLILHNNRWYIFSKSWIIGDMKVPEEVYLLGYADFEEVEDERVSPSPE